MKPDYFHDTIAAISTPVGKGAISIIRISGNKAIQVASKIFYNPKINLLSSPTHVLHYGKIINPSTTEVIDEVLLSVMLAEKSFTREDLIEINCHAGEIIPFTILELLLSLGIRLADAGELTKRAFLNGRIDLTQAEAIHEIIVSQNKLASSIAISNLEKRFSKTIYSIKEELIKICAHLEVQIDYPEEDLEPIQYEKFSITLLQLIKKIDQILVDTQNGRILKQGIKVAIVGKTNVGKSSLFNYFNREDRAIVSHIHGTTRDFLEAHVSLLGIPIQFIDTAGFRETQDEIEKLSKNRSKKMMNEVDYILWMLDYSRDWDDDDDDIFSYIDKEKVIIVINKVDLEKKLIIDDSYSKLNPKEVFKISLLTKMGLNNLEEGLKNLFVYQNYTFNEKSVVCNLRQENLLTKVKSSLEKTNRGLSNQLSNEFIVIDLREALDYLGEIVGEVLTDDILNEIFKNFCVGK